MLLDYRALCDARSSKLLLDGLSSLVMQWFAVACVSSAWLNPAITGPRFLTNVPAMEFGAPLTPSQLARGFLLSVTLFSTFWYVEDPMRGLLGTALRASVINLGSPKIDGGQAPAPRIVVTDVSIVNVENGAISTHRDVEVQDGVIVAIGAHEHRAIGAGVELVDGHGRFLIPGLWDMHTHIKHPEVDFPVYLARIL